MSEQGGRISRRQVLIGGAASVLGGAVGIVAWEGRGSGTNTKTDPTPTGTMSSVPNRNQGLPPAASSEAGTTTTNPERQQKYEYVYSQNRHSLFEGFLGEAGARVAGWVNDPANGLHTNFTSYDVMPPENQQMPSSSWGKLEIPSQDGFPFTVTATVYRDRSGQVDPEKGAKSFSFKGDWANQSVAVYAPGHPEYNVGWEASYSDPDAAGAHTVVISGHSGHTGPVTTELVSGPTALDGRATAEQLEGYDREFFHCVSDGFDKITAALDR